MEIVRPITDTNKIKQIEQILKSNNLRNYIMFELGIYSGLRISDILKLKVKDVRDKTHFILRETKTGKHQTIKIHAKLKEELDQYILTMNDEDYLIGSNKYKSFFTKTKKVKDSNGNIAIEKEIMPNTALNSPINRIQAWDILNKVAQQVGIRDQIGTHSLRKTYGYHHYKQFKDVATLQNIFNHSSPSITLRYIGITQEHIDEMMDNFSY